MAARSVPLKVADAFVVSHGLSGEERRKYSGNPAGVVLLKGKDEDLFQDDTWMQSVALENAYSETAFLVGSDGSYTLRWFTPTSEVDLCGWVQQ